MSACDLSFGGGGFLPENIVHQTIKSNRNSAIPASRNNSHIFATFNVSHTPKFTCIGPIRCNDAIVLRIVAARAPFAAHGTLGKSVTSAGSDSTTVRGSKGSVEAGLVRSYARMG